MARFLGARFVNTFNFSDKGMLEAATAVLVERKKTKKEDLGPKIRLDLLNGAIGGADMSNRRCRFRCKNEEWVYISCSRNADKYVTSSLALQYQQLLCLQTHISCYSATFCLARYS